MAYIDYATTDDLEAYLIVETLPAGSARLLARANELIHQAMLNNYISTNTDHVNAAKLAACAQVEYWQNVGETALSIGGLSSFSIGSTSMNFGQNSGNVQTSPNSLSPRSKAYLNEQGLLYKGLKSMVMLNE